MTCKEVEKKIIFFIEGKLSNTEQDKISQHLANCKSCSEKLMFLEKNFELIEFEKNEKVNPFISTQILAKIDKKSAKKQKSTFIKVFQPILIAAFVILAVWIGNIVSNSYDSFQTSKLQVQNNQIIDNTEQFAINDISYNDYYFIAAQ